MRVDKWLWAARFYKHRGLATTAVEAGRIRVGGESVKPAHSVRVGDTLDIRKAAVVWVVEVTALADRRGSATDAAKLYRETDASRAAREAAVLAHSAAPTLVRLDGRPTKRDRRKLEDFLNEP
jgi:ribosome-associated heat shock protein Hsp15